jgi:hypothetical protein
MTSHLRYDFPVISFGDSGAPVPGGVEVETMYDAEGKTGADRGEEFGTVTLTYEEKPKPKMFVAEFAFHDGDSVTYEGKIPGGGSWKGKEKLKLRRKGRRPRKNEIEVDSWNPKRWG